MAFNASKVLANASVTIKKKEMVKTPKGDETALFTPIYTGVPVKIEIEELMSEAPISVAGRLVRRWYLIHIWSSKKVGNPDYDAEVEGSQQYIPLDLSTIQDAYTLLDEESGKEYEILEINPGSLLKNTQYKLECKCEVYSNSALSNTSKHI